MSKDKFQFSLLPKALRGKVLLFTGQSGSGKSTAAMLDPFNTVLIDADHLKGKTLAEENPQIVYKPVNSRDRGSLTQCGENVLKAVSEIDTDKTTVVILDNIYEIQEGLHAYAIDNAVDVANMYSTMSKGKIVGRKWGENTLAHERLLKGIVDELLSKNITVVIVAHMKDRHNAPGQLEIRGRKWMFEAATFVAIMTKTGGAPTVLVFKNGFHYQTIVNPRNLSPEELEKYRSGELESIAVHQRLPWRIPEFTPSKMFRYLARTPDEIEANPYGQDEILDEDEIDPYVDILTKDQRANVDKLIEMQQEDQRRATELEDNMRESKRVEMDDFIESQGDMSVPDLVKETKRRYPDFATEITPVYIVKLRG